MRVRTTLAAVALLAAGCTTTIHGKSYDTGTAGTPGTPGTPGTSGTQGLGEDTPSGGGSDGTGDPPGPTNGPPAALDRLTQRQYIRTIEAAFPGVGLPAVELPADGTDGIFTTNAPSPLGDFTPYFDAAQTLGGAIAKKLTASCAWADTTKDCVADQLGLPLHVGYRRPITDGDQKVISDLLAEHVKRGVDAEGALAGGVARMLVSPDFIFRWSAVSRRCPVATVVG